MSKLLSLIIKIQHTHKYSLNNRLIALCQLYQTDIEHKLTEQRIVLIGHDTTNETADTILDSGDSDPQTNLRSISRRATVGRWRVTVVVTPGWVRDSSQTSTRDKQEILRSVSMCSPGPHAFLLVIPACTRFTEADEIAMEKRLKFLGEKVWNHSMVLFTRASWMGDTPIELYITSEGETLTRILKKCGNRYHVISNVKDDQRQVETLLEKKEVWRLGTGAVFMWWMRKTKRTWQMKVSRRRHCKDSVTFRRLVW